jgi:predicted nucleic acid-binding protein
LTREKGEELAEQVIAYTLTCHVVPLDTKLALSAAEVSRTHRLSTADSIIYATAADAGGGLLTCDAHFDGLPEVRFFAKKTDDL